ncbi:hypothetical protein BDZ91DRAFT_738783, partial [Kalaharituber pfeilii]
MAGSPVREAAAQAPQRMHAAQRQLEAGPADLLSQQSATTATVKGPGHTTVVTTPGYSLQHVYAWPPAPLANYCGTVAVSTGAATPASPIPYTSRYSPSAGAPVYYRTGPIYQSGDVSAYYRQAAARSGAAATKKKKEEEEAAAKKRKEEEEATSKKEKGEEAARAAKIAADGWNTMYFFGGEDTREMVKRAGLNGVSVEVGEWKWVGEPGNGGFRICEVRKKHNVAPPEAANGLTPALAWHMMLGVKGASSWGYGSQHGTFQPPRPGSSMVPRYAGEQVAAFHASTVTNNHQKVYEGCGNGYQVCYGAHDMNCNGYSNGQHGFGHHNNVHLCTENIQRGHRNCCGHYC